MENSKHDGEAVPRTGATCVGNLTRVGCFSAGQVFISIINHENLLPCNCSHLVLTFNAACLDVWVIV